MIIEYPTESAASSSAKPQRGLGGPKGPVSSQRGGVGVGVTSVQSPSKESESIDTAVVSVQEALGKFIKRETDIQRSEAAAVAAPSVRRRHDHEPQAVAACNSAERPEERFARLQVEVSELLDIAERAASQRNAESSREFSADPASVVEELRMLGHQLAGWKGYDPSNGAAIKAPRGVARSGALSDSLMDKLDRLVSSSQIESAPSESRRVTWEINYAPSIGAIADSSQIAMLESSLADIEKKLGTFEPTPQYADLQTALRHLQRKLSLLDTSKIEALRTGIVKAMKGLDGALDQADEIQANGKDPQLEKQLSELHAQCHRWTPTAAALPAIVSRLQSLQALHHQSADFATRLSTLEHQQDELTKVLEVTNSAVHEMSRGMKENMAVLQDNLRSLEDKLSARGAS